jgi:hypothetical protein
MINTETNMNKSNILVSINSIARNSGYMLKKQIRSQNTYSLAGGLTTMNRRC